jgi:elongation factor P--beta-lysine ligase
MCANLGVAYLVMLRTGASRMEDVLWAPVDWSCQRYFERP